MENKIKIVCISDTHSLHDKMSFIPDGDVLIHAGDGTNIGSAVDISRLGVWLRSQPHKYKILISGNHDLMFEESPSLAEQYLHNGQPNGFDGLFYLKDSGMTLEFDDGSISIYGTPWQPEFHNWAFNLPRGTPLKDKWNMIPEGIDVLVTHCPPASVRDALLEGGSIGCSALYERVMEVKPQLHVFGHIHESYGSEDIDGIKFVNASTCTRYYKPTNKPIVCEVKIKPLS